jgi:ABC-type multidrug transport system fused ATPase/permease subunit
VDLETEVQIRAALEGLMANRTTFIIAHRIQSIMNADQILVFDQGKIVQKGTHNELIKQPGIYQDIYEIQAKIDSALQEEIERVDLL